MSHIPRPSKREIIDGKEYKVTIFTGDGKLYDRTRESDLQLGRYLDEATSIPRPIGAKRVGGLMLQGVCPLYEQVIAHNKAKLAIYSQPVEIRPSLSAEVELLLLQESVVVNGGQSQSELDQGGSYQGHMAE